MEQKANVALVGFMGCGKTSVARLVAEELGFLFVDGDEAIVARAGKSIPQLFAEGEAHFRTLEREVTVALAACQRLCIATGGGAFVDPAIQEALLSSSLVVYLDAPFDVLWERIKEDQERPLLKGPGARERMRALFLKRQASYQRAHVRVAADRPAVEVAEEIVKVYRASGGAYED